MNTNQVLLGFIAAGAMAKAENLPDDRVNRYRLFGAVLPPTPLYLLILQSMIRKEGAIRSPTLQLIQQEGGQPLPPPQPERVSGGRSKRLA